MREQTIQQKVEELFAPTPIYLVGGSVRDELIGREQHDYDFCTKLTPDEIEAVIKGKYKAYKTGKRFGTIGFMLDGEMIEVTTFRSEKYTEGSRKPDVKYVKSLHQDLSRRDFTINAIAKRGNKIIDPYNGAKDIKNKVIRCVGNPRERFKEDPLRILRACRFASQLGFKIERKTMEKMGKMAHHILDVSKERWMQEMDKLLLGDYSHYGLNCLISSKLFNYMIPELTLQYGYDQNSKYHDLTLWMHTKIVTLETPKDINMRWAALLHDIAKPFVRTENKKGHSNYIKHEILGAEIVDRYATTFKWSNERRKVVVDLVKNHLKDDCPLRKYDNRGKK